MAEATGTDGSARRRSSENLSGIRKAAVLLVAVGEELVGALERGLAEPGPVLIEAVLPPGLG